MPPTARSGPLERRSRTRIIRYHSLVRGETPSDHLAAEEQLDRASVSPADQVPTDQGASNQVPNDQ